MEPMKISVKGYPELSIAPDDIIKLYARACLLRSAERALDEATGTETVRHRIAAVQAARRSLDDTIKSVEDANK